MTEAEATPESPATAPVPKVKKPAKATKSTKTKSAAKKTSAKSSAKKINARPTASKTKAYEPSEGDVQLRAYFIAQRRIQLALQGDPAKDWLEARQELLAEAKQSRD